MNRWLLNLALLMLCFISQAQREKVQINPLLIDRDFQLIKNDHVLKPFFNQLDSLQAGLKKEITIVHIGDSHLQGPFFPQYMRSGLQKFNGDAGRGFVFPYRVAKTNGSLDVKFKSDAVWKAVRNVKSDGSDNVGLSGINLETRDANFLLEMNVEQELNTSRKIRVISPHPERFKLSLANSHFVARDQREHENYKVRSGDYLGKIAKNFGTSISEIKKLNGLENDRLNAGQTIKVPVSKKVGSNEDSATLTDLKIDEDGLYVIPAGTSRIYVRANVVAQNYVLDGLVLSNDQPGIIYHAIGVNGTKFSDYNKFPRFFDQLAALEPDLIIVSLGTNESFYSNYTEEELKNDMGTFNKALLKREITGNVLLTSPPPSMKDKTSNSLATAFAYEMGVFANLNSWAFYDLHSVARTSESMEDWYAAGLASSDRIHFLEEGYKLQAQLLLEALFKSYKSLRK